MFSTRLPKKLQNLRSATENTLRLLGHVRAQGEVIVHVPNAPTPTDAPSNSVRRDVSGFRARLEPTEDEPVILKRAANRFAGTDFRDRLMDCNVGELALLGAMSHLCVDTATRAARVFGFAVTVVYDACATHDLSFRSVTIPADQGHAAFMAALEFVVTRTISTPSSFRAPCRK